MSEPTPSPGPASVVGRALAGAIGAGVALAAVGFAVYGLARALGRPDLAYSMREFVAGGAWIRLPLAGAALGAASAVASARGRARVAAAGVALLFGLGAVLLRPTPVTAWREPAPRSSRAKIRAILKWSYRSPAMVARVLELSRDPDDRVREQAVLALGINRIVDDIERVTELRPSRYSGHPLRAQLRDRLLDALARDSVESVRAEAARALWKAPRAFGTQPAAAETLAAVLDRAGGEGALERLAWLALDAAAGAPHPGLKAAARRLAERSPDVDLARTARAAADSAGLEAPHSL